MAALAGIAAPLRYMTHFANAHRRDDASVGAQAERFAAAIGDAPGERTLANSGAVLGELIAVDMATHWAINFDLDVVPEGYEIGVASLPFTQPRGLRVKVQSRRDT